MHFDVIFRFVLFCFFQGKKYDAELNERQNKLKQQLVKLQKFEHLYTGKLAKQTQNQNGEV